MDSGVSTCLSGASTAAVLTNILHVSGFDSIGILFGKGVKIQRCYDSVGAGSLSRNGVPEGGRLRGGDERESDLVLGRGGSVAPGEGCV